MENSLLKIINLIKKTGDNCVVLDNEGNPAFVVMTFGRYEQLTAGAADLSEEQLLDKFNGDIASWQAGNQDKKTDEWPAPEPEKKADIKPSETVNLAENSLKQEKNIIDGASGDSNYYFEPVD